MKKLIALAAILLCSILALQAQKLSNDEILERMSHYMDDGDSKGLYMEMTIKIPILGRNTSYMKTLGDKTYAEVNAMGRSRTTWIDKNTKTKWALDKEKNEVTISDYVKEEEEKEDDSDGSELDDFDTEGYDVTLQKETDKAWYFLYK